VDGSIAMAVMELILLGVPVYRLSRHRSMYRGMRVYMGGCTELNALIGGLMKNRLRIGGRRGRGENRIG